MIQLTWFECRCGLDEKNREQEMERWWRRRRNVSLEIDPYRRRDIDWLVEGAFDTWGQQEPSTGDL